MALSGESQIKSIMGRWGVTGHAPGMEASKASQIDLLLYFTLATEVYACAEPGCLA
jgi:hypothetical protein